MSAELGLPASITTWLLLASIPLALAACTAYTKIAVVLAALRSGLSAERLLPLSSMLALALVITAIVMLPTAEACLDQLEIAGGAAALDTAPFATAARVLDPLWTFMAEQVEPADLELFADLASAELGPSHPALLAPAFLLSQLRAGLALAAMILLPFMVVELICAQALVLLGLSNVSTTAISLPAKLLLFLAADGWTVIVSGLIEGYAT